MYVQHCQSYHRYNKDMLLVGQSIRRCQRFYRRRRTTREAHLQYIWMISYMKHHFKYCRRSSSVNVFCLHNGSFDCDIEPGMRVLKLRSFISPREIFLILQKYPIHPFNHSNFWHIMTSSNGNIFRVTGHLCGEFTGPRWIPRTKASGTELWCFLWSASE